VLLRQSIVCRDPVIYLEPKRRYWTRGTDVLAARRCRTRARSATGPTSPTSVTGPGRHRLQRSGMAVDKGVSVQVLDQLTLNRWTSRPRRGGPLDRPLPWSARGAAHRGFGRNWRPGFEELFYDLGGSVCGHRFDTPYPPDAGKLWFRGRPGARLRREGDGPMPSRRPSTSGCPTWGGVGGGTITGGSVDVRRCRE
jgi:pyruvate dehydrogenase E1 component beta subunit